MYIALIFRHEFLYVLEIYRLAGIIISINIWLTSKKARHLSVKFFVQNLRFFYISVYLFILIYIFCEILFTFNNNSF